MKKSFYNQFGRSGAFPTFQIVEQGEQMTEAKENLYLNADKSKVVGVNSAEQAFLLASKGCEIPKWAVDKFNLQNGELPKNKNAAKSDEDGKKASGPESNKAAQPSENK